MTVLELFGQYKTSYSGKRKCADSLRSCLESLGFDRREFTSTACKIFEDVDA